jgi:formylglycine-generating enzyme required for sulfatase activity
MKSWIASSAGLMVVLAGVARSEGQSPSVFNMPNGQTSLQFVTVGDPGNAGDTQVMVTDGTTGYGSVPYTYQMGTYDVTLSQYTAFLNAVAQTDTYGLYNSHMGTDFPYYFSVNIGITQSGSSGTYSYSVMGNGNVPVFDVTWGDAARFCNWLQNGQLTVAQGGLAITETGAYTLSGATSDEALMLVNRNAGAKYFIPSENEWYKAAYFDPTLNGGAGGYWTYATRSNSVPSNGFSTTGTNNANYGLSDQTNYLTPVGYFAGSPGPYGTFDQGGDVFQWNEANISGSRRGLRGGACYDDSGYLRSSSRLGSTPTYEGTVVGFRVASTPEPASITLLLAASLGVVGVLFHRRRRGVKR